MRGSLCSPKSLGESGTDLVNFADTMDKWDEARLKEVVGQKGNAATTTDIVCKVRGHDTNSPLELILACDVVVLHRRRRDRSIRMVLGVSRRR